jgi:hypothetical protein
VWLQFAHPALLAAGLACVAVPVLIHLLTRRRRKTVRWAAMRFLLEAYRKQKRRLQLEQILLLAARCLLIALIASAIARPFLSDGSLQGSGARTIILAIDNSLSATLTDAQGAVSLDEHKALARTLLGTLNASAGDRVGLIALGGPAQPLVMPPSADLASIARLIDELEPTDSAMDLPGALLEIETLDRPVGSPPPTLVILSDWIRGAANLDQAIKPVQRDLEIVTLSPRTHALSNVAVTNVEPPRSMLVLSNLGPADLSSPIRVSLARSGPGVDEPALSQIRAWLDRPGTIPDPIDLGSATVRWEPGQLQAEASMPVRSAALTAAGSLGLLRIGIDRDAIEGDNSWRVPVELRQALRVAVVAPARFGRQVGVARFEPADWVRLALVPSADNVGGIELIELLPGALDRPRLASVDAVIVLQPDLISRPAWAHLREVVDRGGLVVIAPPSGVAVHAWVDPMLSTFELDWQIGREAQSFDPPQALVRPGAAEASLLRVISSELPYLVESVRVSKHLDVRLEDAGAVALRTVSGQPVLVLTTPEAARGLLVVLTTAFDPSWTDLPTKPLMVPLMQEIVRQGVARGSSGMLLASGSLAPSLDEAVELVPLDQSPRVPLRDAASRPALRHAGAWRALDEAGSPLTTVVTNADASASDTAPLDPSLLADWLAPGSSPAPVLVAAADLESALGGPSLDQASSDAPGFAWVVLLAAAGLALIEMFAARAASHAGVARTEARKVAA